MSRAICDICGCEYQDGDLDDASADGWHRGDYGVRCSACDRELMLESAYRAGVPWSVIIGESKIRDHISQEYLDEACGRPPRDYDDEAFERVTLRGGR